ncbi:MAG: hypothetical protein KDD25_09025 [Bdellovibrionales bacterium]|nr:hypothetical protein [Bdellovibrionales bacterium]
MSFLFSLLLTLISSASAESPYEVLFVPGMHTDSNFKVGSFEFWLPLPRLSFKDISHYLDEEGIANHFAPIEAEANIEPNSEVIRREVKKSDKPVFIVAHSRGGVDALEALIRFPEIREKVIGFYAIQSPFWGTDLSDFLERHEFTRDLAKNYLKFRGGEGRLVHQLTTKRRSQYMLAHATEIQKITAMIPTFTLATRMSVLVPKPLRGVQPIHWVGNLSSDGVVPTSSMYLPGAKAYFVNGVDHLTGILRVNENPFSRVAAFKEMLRQVVTSRFGTEDETLANRESQNQKETITH